MVGPSQRSGGCCAALALAVSVAWAAEPQPGAPRLSELSLEELGNIEITSVSKRAERLSEAPASVFVITAEDIRRSGATSLPEALRLAPNLQVARISSSFHAVTSRGFNGNLANKLLVLIDGRSVYTPLFGGVFWDAQQLPLQDVERIEVISGPAGTLWGVNAVNGVINVITRPASQTPGSELSAGTGNRERMVSVRQGLDLGGSGGEGKNDGAGQRPLRLWARHITEQRTRTLLGESAGDRAHVEQAGARTDWSLAGGDSLMAQAQLYRGRREPPIPGAVEVPGRPLEVGQTTYSGGHVLARWDHRLGGGGSLSVQGYLDRTERRLGYHDRLDTADLQLQHALAPTSRHAVVWGMQVRRDTDRFSGPTLQMLPPLLRQMSYSLFGQDEVTLRDDLKLTLGARAEHNAYTGMEYLPSARLAWQAAPTQLLWAAASRTVRSPTRLDRDLLNPGVPPSPAAPTGVPTVTGSSGFNGEVARVLELGWRGQPWTDTSASATLYRADYEGLRSAEITGPASAQLVNGLKGRVQGLETWGSWQAQPNWRLHAGASRMWQHLRVSPGYADLSNQLGLTEGANPSWQWMLRSQLDLPRRTELDVTLRGVSRLELPAVPAYTALDLRLGWRPSANVEWSLTLQNLLDAGHGEFGPAATRTEIGRSAFLQLVLRHEAP
ncbi:TonB-dependent receptor plug domain-containing protein [Azohydromonas lata]|uniref:TonB-dependent receptor plug domain-containing protein n=1 Tax=Azohydromonas lata TaxID=45677 RepID=UPI0008363E8C|nr:TonB-dependent receptor [Azohydromonas lata]